MKEQYVGDVNDYLKYALLRHLAQQGRIRIGVCWMLTPPDAGNLRNYLKQPDKWRDCDPELFERLRAIIKQEEPNRLGIIECSGIVQNARFFDRQLTGKTREAYFEAALSHFAEDDLVFFDPDTGIAPSVRKKLSRYIYLDEIAKTYNHHHSVLIYQHFPRMMPRDLFIDKLGAQLAQRAPSAQLWCFRTPYAAFLLLIHPNHSAALVAAAEAGSKRWSPQFISGKQLSFRIHKG
jgi:hypothetical protein